MAEPLPKLRGVELIPVEVEGKPRFALRDPHDLGDGTLLLSPEACFIAAHLDGRRGLPELAAAFSKGFNGVELPASVVDLVLKALDEAYLLETPRFERRLAEATGEFRRLPARKAAHAGQGYPAAAGELRELMAAQFRGEGGPGVSAGPAQGQVAGLVAPHIDFARGGPLYAWSYAEVLARPMADLYVILGVAHAGPPDPFVMTLKDFETPFGPAETDRALAGAVACAAGWDPMRWELVHRVEHSVEFQAAWLRYCGAERGETFKILPVLASGLAGPGEDDQAARLERGHALLDAMAGSLLAYPGKVCLVAGADLSHIGRRFGDDFDITPEKLASMEKADRLDLAAAARTDAEGWLRSVLASGANERNVCGLSALYAFCRLLRALRPGLEGRLLRYGHAPDPAGGEVSFASMVYLS